MTSISNILDLLAKFKRGPQVILPKDAAALVGLTGVSSGWHCLDAGSGSGWLAAFVGNLIRPNGKLVSYERDERWFTVAKENIKAAGLDKIVKIKKGDIAKAPELKKANSLDLITLDAKEPELIVPKAAKALKSGGFLAVYSPHIEQQMRIMTALSALPKAQQFVNIKSIETIQRPWHVGPGPFTHPEISGILHTGFWTVARKAIK
jgi:tRNA (adenine57-N1/adenine58-N1)-methyltransferase